jgi:hypothetical protein
MTNTISRSQAKTWTLGAQLASVVFVLGAVALGVVGLPEPKTGATIDTTNNGLSGMPGMPTPTGRAQDDGSHQPAVIDTIGLAQRFALLDNAPNIVDNTPTETSIETNENTAIVDDGEIVKRVRYIGFINDPQSRHAFIRIDGKQRIVSLGQIAKAGDSSFPDLTIERIMPAYIVLTDGKKRAQIQLATRVGQSITMAGGGKVDVALAAENGSLLTADDEAAIAAMPPRQQPRARARLERERRGLPPDKENRRPTPEPLATVRSGFNRDRQNNNRNQND